MEATYSGFDQDEDFFIFTDECRLQQVVLNYQSNALKFTPRDGKITIQCTLMKKEDANNQIKISVADTGLGIQQDDIPKLFQLFGFLNCSQQLNTKGIGLGLHICKKIAIAFGGDVYVESEYNVGSTFSFWFLLAKQEFGKKNNSAVRILNPADEEERRNLIVVHKVNHYSDSEDDEQWNIQPKKLNNRIKKSSRRSSKVSE